MFATNYILIYSQVLNAWLKLRYTVHVSVIVFNRLLKIRLSLSNPKLRHTSMVLQLLSTKLHQVYSRSRAQELLIASDGLWSFGSAQLSIMHLKQFCVQQSLFVIARRGTQPQSDGF